jgi:hypothetical protein
VLAFAIVNIEHGWLNATLSNGEETVAITASYLSDAPGDLLRATLSLVEGAPEARVIWMEEPGEYRFILRGAGIDLHLELLWFDDWSNRRSDAQGKTVLKGQERLESWRKQVASEFNRLYREWGEDGYKERWIKYEFPTAEFQRLRVAHL